MVQATGALVLLRHGESTANARGLFTGVLDAPLSLRGIREAGDAAGLLRLAGPRIDAVVASELTRAVQTAQLIAADLRLGPVLRDWRLNERNYGALTGLAKTDVLHDFGPEAFRRWRRTTDAEPPPMSDDLYQRLASCPPFDRLPSSALTRTESLRAVMSRAGLFLQDASEWLRRGLSLLVVAHGNSLRALCALIDELDDREIEELNIPTGYPLVYAFTADLNPITRGGTYLDEERAQAAAAEVAAEGGT